MAIAFVLVAVFMVVEFVTAVATCSPALLSDARHMATDVLGLGMALAAITAASRVDPSGYRPYGLYRLEILAALANAILLAASGAGHPPRLHRDQPVAARWSIGNTEYDGGCTIVL